MQTFREWLREAESQNSELNEMKKPTVKQNSDILNYTRIKYIVELDDFGGDKKAFDKFRMYLDETDKKLKEAKKLIDEAVKYYYDFTIPSVIKDVKVKYETLTKKITKDMMKFDGIIIDEENKLLFYNGPLTDVSNGDSNLSKELTKITKKHELIDVEALDDLKLATGVLKRGTLFNIK